MPTLPQVILFDLDDTIVDFESSGQPAACWLATIEAHAAALGGIDPTTAHAAIARTRKWFWSDPARSREGSLNLRATSALVVRTALAELGAIIDEPRSRAIADDYRDRRDAGLRLFDGAAEALDHLRLEGLRLGLVTNGATADQRAKIARFGLEPYFQHILISGEFGEGKPHPSVYEHALRALDAAPADAWFVGDNLEWDVATPQRHGMTGIWVDAPGAGLPPTSEVTPHRIIRHIRELVVDG